MKKIFGVLIFFVVMISSVSALDLASGLGLGAEQVVDIVENFFGPFFTAILGGSSDMLFERILFLAIVFCIVFVVISGMDVFKDNLPVIWIVSVSVSLLSTRFLSESGLVETMILPYSTLGVALSCALPFLIYFTFVEKFSGRHNSILRKILWIFFIVIFIGLWGARYDQVGELSWIYLLTAGLALLCLLLDGTIQEIIIKNERMQRDVKTKEEHLAKLRKDLEDLRLNEKNYSNPKIFNSLVKDAMNRIKRAEKAKF